MRMLSCVPRTGEHVWSRFRVASTRGLGLPCLPTYCAAREHLLVAAWEPAGAACVGGGHAWGALACGRAFGFATGGQARGDADPGPPPFHLAPVAPGASGRCRGRPRPPCREAPRTAVAHFALVARYRNRNPIGVGEFEPFMTARQVLQTLPSGAPPIHPRRGRPATLSCDGPAGAVRGPAFGGGQSAEGGMGRRHGASRRGVGS